MPYVLPLLYPSSSAARPAGGAWPSRRCGPL